MILPPNPIGAVRLSFFNDRIPEMGIESLRDTADNAATRRAHTWTSDLDHRKGSPGARCHQVTGPLRLWQGRVQPEGYGIGACDDAFPWSGSAVGLVAAAGRP